MSISDSLFSSEDYSSGPPSSDSTEYTRQLKNILQGVVNLIPPQMFLQAIILGDYSAIKTREVRARYFEILRAFSKLRGELFDYYGEKIKRDLIAEERYKLEWDDDTISTDEDCDDDDPRYDVFRHIDDERCLMANNYLREQIGVLATLLPLYPVYYIFSFFWTLFHNSLERDCWLRDQAMTFDALISDAIELSEEGPVKRSLSKAMSYMINVYLNSIHRNTPRVIELLVPFIYLATPELYGRGDKIKKEMATFAVAIGKEKSPQKRLVAAYKSISLLYVRIVISEDFRDWELRQKVKEHISEYALLIKDVARKEFKIESIPDTPITFTNIVNRLNRIAHVIDLNKLITFVRDGVWKVNISKKSVRRQYELFVIEVYWFLETFDIDDGGDLGAYLRRHIGERISKKPMVILALNLVPFILYGLQQQPLFGERYIAKIKRLNDVVRSFGLSAITNFAQVGESYMEYLQTTARDMNKNRESITLLLDLFIRCCFVVNTESREVFREDFWWTREYSSSVFSKNDLKINLEMLLLSFKEPRNFLNISRMEMSGISSELWWLLKELNERDGERLPSGLERPVLMFM